MGCDIHLEIEQKDKDGIWHLVPRYDQPCRAYCCEGGRLSDKVPNKSMRGAVCSICEGEGHYIQGFYSDRDYDVFAILANVRNGRDGGDLGDGYVPLSDDRGFPDDLSFELEQVLDWGENGRGEEGDEEYEPTIWMGDHSFTWLLYAELLRPAYWQQTTKSRGWVDAWNFELWRRQGRPSAWSGGSYGGAIEHVSNSFLSHIIDSGDLKWVGEEPSGWLAGRNYTTSYDRVKQGDEKQTATRVVTTKYYTLVEWEVSYSEQAAYFLQRMKEVMEHLGNPAPEDVRLVMGFDN
jgi:hypothetical protein